MDYFGVTWLIAIKGKKLKKCEFTQFISANTQLWDAAGKELTKEDVLAAFKASKSFLKRVLDRSPRTRRMVVGVKEKPGDNLRMIIKKRLRIVHDSYIPHYMSGAEKKYYAYRITRDMVVKVRKKGGPVLKELEWSYDLRNYSGDSPKAPIETREDTGFYDYRNIQDVPWDKKKK